MAKVNWMKGVGRLGNVDYSLIGQEGEDVVKLGALI